MMLMTRYLADILVNIGPYLDFQRGFIRAG
jgi:hypothetical protein